MLTHPGVYCLRSNETTWDAAKAVAHLYLMLTDLEAVFRRTQNRSWVCVRCSTTKRNVTRTPVHYGSGLSIGPDHPASKLEAAGEDIIMVPSARAPVGATAGDGDVPPSATVAPCMSARQPSYRRSPHCVWNLRRSGH